MKTLHYDHNHPNHFKYAFFVGIPFIPKLSEDILGTFIVRSNVETLLLAVYVYTTTRSLFRLEETF